MLSIALKIMLIAMLIVLFLQDIRRREVSLYLLLSVLTTTIFLGFVGKSLVLADLLFNGLFIVVQVLFLAIYLYITGRKPSLLLKDFLGLGDILFWVIPAFYLSPVEFVLFSLVCYVAIVIGYGILLAIKRNSTTIPLAGLMALFFAVYMVVAWECNNCLSQLAYNLVIVAV